MTSNNIAIVSGIIALVSLLLDLWVYMQSRRTKAIEVERNVNMFHDILSISTSIMAADEQAKLIASIADRDEVTKKELKHLTIALISTLNATKFLLSQHKGQLENWKFGIPSRYISLRKDQESRTEA
jgi:acyl-CoA hydrolase